MKNIFIEGKRIDNQRTIFLGVFEMAKQKFENYEQIDLSLILIIECSDISGYNFAVDGLTRYTRYFLKILWYVHYKRGGKHGLFGECKEI
jgi:hypothetical protein